jgi:[CysO sulfur-carrier protein]-S-L-cysteine hydrolase
MLTLNPSQRDAMVAACIRALPNEGCGLLLGTIEGLVHEVIASPNIADSAKVYEIEPTVLLRASRRADAEGLELIGVFHSHTHSEAFPSPTDVRQAPDPTWHYVLISLVDSPADLRSFRIIDGDVVPEVVDVTE